jgi:hypothetical protein
MVVWAGSKREDHPWIPVYIVLATSPIIDAVVDITKRLVNGKERFLLFWIGIVEDVMCKCSKLTTILKILHTSFCRQMNRSS